ncbi:hypothetical protein QO014_000643 [Kaistia dalseonensis]|uniref:Uncharacterized protein n=1 Tax=Kaistia dalseonensis TaxID=410840 RepID=A0ABU0H2Z9_9HYPH|nr:hypothetical protein [Kaistia dalseonensis]
MSQESLARSREPHARPAAMEERLPDQFLQAMHLHAQRRLGASDLLRGEADRSGAGDNDEVSQQGEIEEPHSINPVDIGLKQYQLAWKGKGL